VMLSYQDFWCCIFSAGASFILELLCDIWFDHSYVLSYLVLWTVILRLALIMSVDMNGNLLIQLAVIDVFFMIVVLMSSCIDE